MEQQSNKAHRPAHSGAKADKKSKAKGKEKQHGFNEKVRSHIYSPYRQFLIVLQAFAPKSGRRAERQGRRKVERDQTRLHVPLVDRTPDDQPPPVIVAIVGPPGVGKTTLLKSLVRRYTKQTLNEVKGPVTVVSGKKKRITFIECNNDLNSMIDIGKIADLVLLMIDGSYGFEMVRRCGSAYNDRSLTRLRKPLSSSISSSRTGSRRSSASLLTSTSSRRPLPSVQPRKPSRSASGPRSTRVQSSSTSPAL